MSATAVVLVHVGLRRDPAGQPLLDVVDEQLGR
jgi:hypothetical protein